jgi:ABC-type dipeptide/oligopeptide/nickel transport system permease subunit
MTAADSSAEAPLGLAATLAGDSAAARLLRLLRRQPRIPVFAGIMAAVLSACLLAPQIAPYDPRQPRTEERLQGPSREHLLGTDQLGRDTFSRLLYGGRTAIPLGLMAVGIAAIIGIGLGLAAGYFGGIIDEVTGRLVDAQLAFPELLLAVAIVNTFGASLLNVMIVVGLTSYPASYRLTRGQTLQAKQFEYVTAARSLGASEPRLILRHILPNILSPLIVQTSLAAGSAVLLQSTLSFFGLGPSIGTPDWGFMFQDALANYRVQPWLMLGPGLAVFISVFSFYMLGDALQDALAPDRRGGTLAR